MYVVTFTYDMAQDEETLTEWGALLDEHDASVAAVPGGYAITVWIDAPDPVKAIAGAEAVAARFAQSDAVGVESVAEDEYLRRADAPTLPVLVSAPEVAEMLGGISRQRVHQLRSQASFPAPVLDLRTGPIWTADAIDRFGREWKRQPGRPRVAS